MFDKLEGISVIDLETLIGLGLAAETKNGLKVLGNGDIKGAYTVRAAAFTSTAKEKIEAAGGKCEVI